MKKLILIALYLVLARFATYSQNPPISNFDDVIHGLTTIIKVIDSNRNGLFYRGQGSAFFFHKYRGERQPSATMNEIDSSLESVWLITNKHVIFGDNYRTTRLTSPVLVEFYLRKRMPQGQQMKWDTLRISRSVLNRSMRISSDSTIDIFAINVTNFVLSKVKPRDSLYYYSAISKLNFPTDNTSLINGWPMSSGNDILTIGYPREFYDQYNLFPTVKAGIIASKWGMKYDGSPYFLIDAKLFPGSSGSIVITQSIKAIWSGGDGIASDYFHFLGVYSGELYRKRETMELDDMSITRKESYNTGIVWYYYLLNDLIQ